MAPDSNTLASLVRAQYRPFRPSRRRRRRYALAPDDARRARVASAGRAHGLRGDQGYAEWIAPDFSINAFWTYGGATIVVWLVNWGHYSLLDNVFGERTVLA